MKRGLLALAAVAIALLILAPLRLNGYGMDLLYVTVLSIGLAYGWNIISGYAGYFSFGQIAFFGLGAYATALLVARWGWYWVPAALAGGVVSVALAIPLGYAMLRLRGTELTPLSEDVVVNSPMSDSDRSSTVGAVARDAGGHLAASTSSGGTSNKYAGRVGQASQVGSGVYADDATCAVSCTGHGEAFMRAAAAFDVSALMAYLGLDVTAAATTVVRDRLGALDARGGLIALDARGDFALPFNTQGMYRGWVGDDGLPRTAIYEDWLLGEPYPSNPT